MSLCTIKPTKLLRPVWSESLLCAQCVAEDPWFLHVDNEDWADAQVILLVLSCCGISTLWHFRLPLPIQMFIKVASSPRLSGIGMPSPILWSHPLKMQRIVLLSSLLWWELGTNSLITGPGEWLSFRRFTSKLSWSYTIIESVVYRFIVGTKL